MFVGDSGGSSIGAIAGGVTGAILSIVIIVIIIVVIYYFVFYRKKGTYAHAQNRVSKFTYVAIGIMVSSYKESIHFQPR